MGKKVVILEHDSYEHIGSNEGIHEHKENDQDFRINYLIWSHHRHIDIPEESL